MLKPHRVTHRPALIGFSLLLAFALGLGAAGQISAVQAAPAPDFSKNVYLNVTKTGSAERTICVGDKVAISARVLTVVDVLADPNAEKQFANLLGVPLQASLTNPSIGAISPAAAVTTVAGDPAGQVDFTFTAQQPGATTIQVQGQLIQRQVLGVALSSDTVTGQLPLTVEKCAYRVDATGVWHMEGKITLIAEITNAALAATGPGKYAGNADVSWYGETDYPPPCHVVHHAAPSRAFITGEVVGASLLQVKVVWEATPALAGTLICPTASSPVLTTNNIEPDDLRFWVPTSGGTARRQPALTGATTLDRLAIFTVAPEPSH